MFDSPETPYIDDLETDSRPSSPPLSSPPLSAPPLSAPPLSASPLSSPPLSASPLSASPLSASPLSSPPLSASPLSASLIDVRPDGLKADEAPSGLYNAERTFPCSGRTHLFFAPAGERRVRREKREATARSYCDQCSVKEMCKVAGRTGREHGIWGGENDEERTAAGYAPMFPHRKAIVRAAQEAKQHPPLSA